jgi:predicted 3-demethylubiquinone-9 3-methyltransferase (glyoxalase superfamily)
MQKIMPFLWFDSNAEEAMNFYVSIFKNSKVLRVVRYGDAAPRPKGTVMVASFQLEGQEFQALNGGPQYKFTPAISLFVSCETQLLPKLRSDKDPKKSQSVMNARFR